MKIDRNIPISSVSQAKGSKEIKKTNAKNTEAARAPEDKVNISSQKAAKKSAKRSTTHYDFRKGNYAEALTDGDQILKKIDKMISGAEKAVQVQMYRLGHDKIVDLLAQQARQGVKVQVLLDPTPGYDKNDIQEQKQIRKYLTESGVEVLNYPIDGPARKIDHVKMLIVDGKSLLIGGMNWDKHSPSNQDSDVYIRGPALKDAGDVFQNDWKLAGGKDIPGLKYTGKAQKDANAEVRMLTTEVDRKDINTAIQENIKKAKKSIRMEAFALTDKTTINNLIDAKNRGVDVRVLLDPNIPVFYVNRKTAKTLRQAGIPVRWLDVDIDKREKLHEKLMVFDDDKTIIGSANFTKAGLSINHEADVEVISKAVGTAFTKMFDEHWENRSVPDAPVLPDFNEKVRDYPKKEHLARDIYRYFTKSFHPKSNRIWAGKRQAAVRQYVTKYDKIEQPAPLQVLGHAGDEEAIDETKEMAAIGDLASFFGDVKEFKMNPKPGEDVPIYDRRVEIAEKSAEKVHKNIPKYLKDMANAIKDKELRNFVEKAFEKAPEGFFKAPSSSSGRYHPADECDPDNVNISPSSPSSKYKGGGLVLHSRRDQAMAERLCDHYGVKGKERDEIMAALALHDIMKGVTMEDMKEAMKEGKEIPWEHTTTPEHGAVAAEWIKMLDTSKGKKLTKNVRRLVENHMGVWNQPESTPPDDVASFIVSMSDYIVSQRNFYLEV